MLNREDIESFLIRAEVDFQEVGDGIWLVLNASGVVGTGGEPHVVVTHQPPVLVLRADLGDVPVDESEELVLYKRLLELNAADLVHGAYGLEDGEIILSDTLELENLDFSEFRASLESLTLALRAHWGEPAPAAEVPPTEIN
jgi:hypothetical protein